MSRNGSCGLSGTPWFYWVKCSPEIQNLYKRWISGQKEKINNMTAREILEKFGGKNLAEFGPTDRLPGGWVEVVATWPGLGREWQDHPQVKAWRHRGKFCGWDRRGNRLWTGEG